MAIDALHALVEHDLFRKPVSTFRDHALSARPCHGDHALARRVHISNRPSAVSSAMATVPDIRLQKPATIVADITTQKRQPSMGWRRRRLRMMMNGAAKTRNGTAAKVAACGPAC